MMCVLCFTKIIVSEINDIKGQGISQNRAENKEASLVASVGSNGMSLAVLEDAVRDVNDVLSSFGNDWKRNESKVVSAIHIVEEVIS